jgi:uncharacterized OB-fold protein
MTRAIHSVSVHRPSWSDGGRSREGPDEDGITLAVTAVEALRRAGEPWTPALDTVHLVGAFPSEAEGAIPEAIGAPAVMVRHHRDGLASALCDAAAAHGRGSSLVLVADIAPEGGSTGSGALAAELSDAPGWVPLGHGGRRHPSYRTPDAKAWVAEAARAAHLAPPGDRGLLLFVAPSSAPVLLRSWVQAFPAHPIVEVGSEPDGLGGAPNLPFGLALHALSAEAPPGEEVAVAFLRGEATEFLGLRRTGPVRWIGPTGFPAASGAPSPPHLPDDLLRAVSEGAHVPRPRYVENLPSRWRFAADRCSACGTISFPRRGRCRQCGAREGLAEFELPREGTVEASTVVAPGAQPTEFDPLVARTGAYGVVLVKLSDGARATLMVADGTNSPLPIGNRVGTQLRRLYPIEGEWRYGRKAVPTG